MRRRSGAVLAAVATVVGVNELLLVLALALIARGLLEVWHPGAYLAPGVVVLWIVLPTRRAFIVTADDSGRRKS